MYLIHLSHLLPEGAEGVDLFFQSLREEKDLDIQPACRGFSKINEASIMSQPFDITGFQKTSHT